MEDPGPITKRSPISLDFLKAIGDNTNCLEAYDQVRLTPSENALAASRDVASKVIQALEECPMYVGRAVLTGSTGRDVRLKKPQWSDIDIICLLDRDKNGDVISTFEEFERIRFSASHHTRKCLERRIKDHFCEAFVVHNVRGFVIKLEVKRQPFTINPWKIDILFGLDLEINNNPPQWGIINRQLEALPLGLKLKQTNSMAPFRDEFFRGFYDRDPPLKPLVRLSKAFVRIVTGVKTIEEHAVYGFPFEMLILLLFANKYIPVNFSLPHALATCYKAIAAPAKLPALCFPREKAGGDALNRPPAPKKEQLAAMKKAAGANCLVLVDPFAPFNNMAAKKKKQMGAWEVLEAGAADMLEFLKSKNITPYVF